MPEARHNRYDHAQEDAAKCRTVQQSFDRINARHNRETGTKNVSFLKHLGAAYFY